MAASKQQQQLGQDALHQEEDYIDMDLTSAATAASSAAAHGEFEFNFPMSGPLGGGWEQPETLASPADELFYKGKLLPLHMPPRVKMVEDLLDGGGGRRRPLAISTAPATPYESCAASPANSCYGGGGGASGELNVEVYFQEYAARLADAAAAAACEKKPWSRKLRFMRQLNLGLKLKASKAYIKTIFAASKPGIPPACDDDDKYAAVLGATTRGGEKELSHGGNGHRAWRKNPFGHIRSSNKSIAASPSGGGENGGHRRSFSSVIVRYSASNYKAPPSPPPPSCSSSSKSSTSTSSERSSSESDGGASAALRSSSGSSSEVENPIQGLIAYCKKSQQLASVRKSASDAGFRFLSSAASKIAAEESDCLEELVEICRG